MWLDLCLCLCVVYYRIQFFFFVYVQFFFLNIVFLFVIIGFQYVFVILYYLEWRFSGFRYVERYKYQLLLFFGIIFCDGCWGFLDSFFSIFVFQGLCFGVVFGQTFFGGGGWLLARISIGLFYKVRVIDGFRNCRRSRMRCWKSVWRYGECRFVKVQFFVGFVFYFLGF